MLTRMLRATRLLAMCQAADLTGAGLLAEPVRHGYGRVRGQGPRVSEDRRLAPGICRLAAEIRSGSLQAAWRIPESVPGTGQGGRLPCAGAPDGR
jgi:histidine ammonia-lyase